MAYELGKIVVPAFVRMLWTVAPWSTLFLFLDSFANGVLPPLKSWIASLVLNEIQRSISGHKIDARWIISLAASTISLSIVSLILSFGRRYSSQYMYRKMEIYGECTLMEAKLRSDMPGLLHPAIRDILGAAKIFVGDAPAIDRKGSSIWSAAVRNLIGNTRDVRPRSSM